MFWAIWGILMKFSGNMGIMIILKVTKEIRPHSFFRRYIFRKTTEGGGSNWPPTAVLG